MQIAIHTFKNLWLEIVAINISRTKITKGSSVVGKIGKNHDIIYEHYRHKNSCLCMFAARRNTKVCMRVVIVEILN
jgi:hypothetical protein